MGTAVDVAPLLLLLTLLVLPLLLAMAGSGSDSGSPQPEGQAHPGDPEPLQHTWVPVLIAASPSSVTGGLSVAFQVTLGSPAASPRTVGVTTNHPEAFANLPASVVVPGGTTMTSFVVTTVAPATTVVASVAAAYGSDSSSTTVTVSP